MCVINGAQDFTEYANKITNGISCLYLAENKIMSEPQDIKTSPKMRLIKNEIDRKRGCCKERYKENEEWLGWEFCKQWFHVICFEN